jgi:phage shock protein E
MRFANTGVMKKIWIYLCALASLMPGAKAADKPPRSPASKTAPNTSVTNLNAEDAASLLKTNHLVVVLDVRTPEEFASGHIAGATNLNYFDAHFQEKLAKLDKTRPCLVHCASGSRSAQAREILKKLNFQQIFHLDGGIKAWQKAGKPVQQ